MDHKVRILAGSVVQQDPIVLEHHLRLLKNQDLDQNIGLDYVFIDDNLDKSSSALLCGDAVFAAEPKPDDHSYRITDETHHWNISTFHWLGAQKQRLLNYAREEGYNYFWLVDSDLLCDRTTLRSLLSLQADIASAVFWTRWNPSMPPLPQVWLRHPYEMEGLGMPSHVFMKCLEERKVIRVVGGGACCLIKTDITDRVRYSPPVANLPDHNMWQGEDRTFAINAAAFHINQYADGWPDIYHAYHPAQRKAKRLEKAAQILSGLQQEGVGFGDYVSFTIEPLEDAALASDLTPDIRSVRGRFGALRVAPEIEDAILDMAPGDERIIEITFPVHHKFQDYRGKTKMYLLRLVDVKPAIQRAED